MTTSAFFKRCSSSSLLKRAPPSLIALFIGLPERTMNLSCRPTLSIFCKISYPSIPGNFRSRITMWYLCRVKYLKPVNPSKTHFTENPSFVRISVSSSQNSSSSSIIRILHPVLAPPHGQADRYRRPVKLPACQFNFSVMQPDQFVANGQPQPGPLGFVGKKRLEHIRLFAFVNADPVILDLDFHVEVLDPGLHPDPPVVMLYRLISIIQDVDHHFPDLEFIGLDVFVLNWINVFGDPDLLVQVLCPY